MPLKLPVQVMVDRSDFLQLPPLDAATLDTRPLPSDPAGFQPQIDPRLATCQLLSGYAAIRCLAGRSY